MGQLRVSLHPAGSGGEAVELDALDVAAALTIASINVDNGEAELHDGERVLARLVKHGKGNAAYWQVS